MDSIQIDNSSENIPMVCFTSQADDELRKKSNCDSVSASEANDIEELVATEDLENGNKSDYIKFTPKLYMRRWAVLASYCLLTISNLASWYAFSSISNILQRYYHINLIQVNWLAMSFSTVSIVVMIPSYHLLERIGLGMVMVVAGFFNALGCSVRYFGYSHATNGYWFLLVGNILCGISASAFLFLPVKIAALWFGEKERAKATSIAISADSLGLALGYFVPTSIVRNRPLLADIDSDLGKFLLSATIESIVVLLFICVSMKNRPLTPPSYSESLKARRNMEVQSRIGISGYKKLLKNIHFHAIANIHGILFGIESVFLVALNEILIRDFPGYEREIGIMGSMGLLLCIPTSFLVGVLLDRTRAFKRITISTISLCSVLTALLGVLFYVNAAFYTLFATYLTIVSICATYFITACNHCAELTYPVSEAQSGVILVWVAQVYSVVLAQAGTWVLFYIGHKELVFFILGLYCAMFVVSFFVKDLGPRPLSPV